MAEKDILPYQDNADIAYTDDLVKDFQVNPDYRQNLLEWARIAGHHTRYIGEAGLDRTGMLFDDGHPDYIKYLMHLLQSITLPVAGRHFIYGTNGETPMHTTEEQSKRNWYIQARYITCYAEIYDDYRYLHDIYTQHCTDSGETPQKYLQSPRYPIWINLVFGRRFVAKAVKYDPYKRHLLCSVSGREYHYKIYQLLSASEKTTKSPN
ncbi:MAG: hypothetical protein GY938_14035, partial [Ketobacter sp.]|nr:hypothetical protein [Ketobacter sp.]